MNCNWTFFFRICFLSTIDSVKFSLPGFFLLVLYICCNNSSKHSTTLLFFLALVSKNNVLFCLAKFFPSSLLTSLLFGFPSIKSHLLPTIHITQSWSVKTFNYLYHLIQFSKVILLVTSYTNNAPTALR